jgi:RecA-family ATPase
MTGKRQKLLCNHKSKSSGGSKRSKKMGRSGSNRYLSTNSYNEDVKEEEQQNEVTTIGGISFVYKTW